ncbi:peptide chain release factor N(5)-glutamine methyltransferase [Clostridium tarantellae]|uniref:Release factor glutamine methyltransferase n=1 Tax=Clostridium tarantellae TaxID=39493 RepID=A0A6I1MG69_9CLOT|nr:peptide chain release factor N(5)-glutamine methyltransferase [Clostridium tarantellae]MPQ42526.1 peptide chain release factor N(5)-glutamine methyltransferase [Clostridium tarantellae]
MKKSQVGGQAVLEGVMMRGKKGIATAVRTPKGDIEVKFDKSIPYTKKYKFFSLPIVRGFITLIDSLVVGLKSLNFSAEFFDDVNEEPSKLEKWLMNKLGEKFNDVIIGLTMIISIFFAIVIFMAIPTGITFLLKKVNFPTWSLSIIEGVISISILLSYMYFIGRLDDIQRVFQYHGAEHKAIFCYENEEELTVKNVKKYSRFHPRCGTNFLFLVAIVSILIFSFTKWDSIVERTTIRILLLPLVSGVTYELIKWLGNSNGKLSKIIAAPGLKLQSLTTREPDDSQIEVAIVSLMKAEGLENTQKSVGELLEFGNNKLKEVLINTYILDTQLLLSKVLNKEKLWIITNRNEKVSIEDENKFYNLLSKREKKMPMQYILGFCEFMGLDFKVKEGVLIPRGDTEILVEEVLKNINDDSHIKVCDLCCGSGAIGLSLAYYRKNILVDLIDIDHIPEFITKENIKLFNLDKRCNFKRSDLFNELKDEKYNIIVSNPPYIKEELIDTLMEDVKNYEPHLALSGGEDGLIFYRRIVKGSKEILNKNGILAFEIGHDQGEDVRKLMEKNSYINVKVIKDLAGLDRVVIGCLNLET